MKIQVFRTDTSGYFPHDFAQMEKKELEQLKGVQYRLKAEDVSVDAPLVLITNTSTDLGQIPRQFYEMTKLIIHPNSGHDNIKGELVDNRQFPIVLGNPIRAKAVATTILSILFERVSKVPSHDEWDKHRQWDRVLLDEKKILILGHGHIGRILEQGLAPLCDNLEVYDPKYGQKDLLLKGTDVVLLACDLNRDNRGMVDRNFLSQLAPNFILINAARGQLIVESDLISILKERPEAFAYLDVFESEPCRLENFGEISNLQTTSHIAGVYNRLPQECIRFEKEVLQSYLSGDLEQKFKPLFYQ